MTRAGSTKRQAGIVHRHAREQVQRVHWYAAAHVQPLPPGQPGRVTGPDVGIDQKATQFAVIGDTGGVRNPHPQVMVAQAIPTTVGFVYHVGDVVYYNGNANEHAAQFYEPYAHLTAPIVAIPGNHDGEPDPTISDLSLTGISTFIQNFCSATPLSPPCDPDGEYGRHTQTQPYVDWTLALDTVTIIGVWTNVVAGGRLEPSQAAWLTSELAAAPADLPLIVALHHPPYSVDTMHGGSKLMGDLLDVAFRTSKRWPSLVISGHVHTYQRFTRAVQGRGKDKEKSIPYVVCGNGGYSNLHSLAEGAHPGALLAGGVTFEYGDDTTWGFLVLTINGQTINGEYFAVDPTTGPSKQDTFSGAL